MTVVVPYYQDHDETDDKGRIIRKKGVYVDYGVDTKTMHGVCLPSEEFYSFVRRNCIFNESAGEYYIKD